jgi:hypothetical protein
MEHGGYSLWKKYMPIPRNMMNTEDLNIFIVNTVYCYIVLMKHEFSRTFYPSRLSKIWENAKIFELSTELLHERGSSIRISFSYITRDFIQVS